MTAPDAAEAAAAKVDGLLAAGTRIRRALDAARPRIGAVELQGIDEDGIVRLRMTAGAHGCGSSARHLVETIVRQAAPDTAGVEVAVAASPPPLYQVSRRAPA